MSTSHGTPLVWLLLGLAATAGWAAPGGSGSDGPRSMQLTSSAFGEGESIPVRHTCQGGDVSPPLSWSGVPDAARSLVLVVDDPDAPGGSWVHWVVYNLPADSDGLPAGVSGTLPGGAAEGLNSWGRAEYGGPCPPSGRHRYVFEIYALDTRLNIDLPSAPSLRSAMAPHVLTRARLMAVYARH